MLHLRPFQALTFDLFFGPNVGLKATWSPFTLSWSTRHGSCAGKPTGKLRRRRLRAAFVMGLGRPMYMSALMLIGRGLQHRTFDLGSESVSSLGFHESMNARIGLGVRGKQQSFDLNIVWDVWRSSIRNVVLDSSNLGLALTYGIRI